MKMKMIKTEGDYQAALARIDELMDARLGTPEGEELDLLSHLVEVYEERVYPIPMPSPIEAIRFRMEQQGLKPNDLCPYIGSASRVSEILSGNRSLSLRMVRNLHEGLGIPAEVLIGSSTVGVTDTLVKLEWERFPVKEMAERGWINLGDNAVPRKRNDVRDLLEPFFRPVLPEVSLPMAARQHIRGTSKMDEYAVLAWRAKVLLCAMEEQSLPLYAKGLLSDDFMRELVKLSYLQEGPRLAREFLAKNGIHLIVLPHLPRTFMDGAAMFTSEGRPVVAVTLRYDRMDSFWFTLCHELGHVAFHLSDDQSNCFIDDLDLREKGKNSEEEEADRFAADSLVPPTIWAELRSISRISTRKVREVASSLRVHPGIIAGRIQYEMKRYNSFRGLLGEGTVRRLFGL
jgi:HTH-type transcriptional regulator/antitoxin HigA